MDDAEHNPSGGRRDRKAALFAGRYRIQRLIAEGGMGKVYLAEQTPLGRPVALKIMGSHIEGARNDEFRKRFMLEASTCAQLNHANIVTVHDYGQTSRGELYLVMEFLNGRTLASVLKTETRLPPERTSHIILQVCRALRMAHRASYVHRDLKPSNIMLLDDAERKDFVKVIDFGLAKVSETNTDKETIELTRPGGWLGSPPYMAPEQFRSLESGPQTDIYSVGIIMYRCLFGVLPFAGKSHVEIMERHLREPLAWPPEAVDHPELSLVIERCLQKRPNRRYPSMNDLMNALNEANRLANLSVDIGSLGSASSPSMRSGGQDADFPHVDLPDSTLTKYQHVSASRSMPSVSATGPDRYLQSGFSGLSPSQLHAPPNPEPTNEVVALWWLLVLVLGAILAVILVLLNQGVDLSRAVS